MPETAQTDESTKSGAEPGLEPAPDTQPNGNAKPKRSAGRHPLRFNLGCAFSFLVFTALVWFCWNWNPLPKDEEMIANFLAHRTDFEEIVRRYREYPDYLYPADGPFWYERGDTLELFKRAGIDDVKYIGWQPWLPSPYSVETALEINRIVDEDDPRFPGLTLWQRYGALQLNPATTPLIEHPRMTDNRRHWRSSLRYGVVWKKYVFFPEAPRVENGTLFWSSNTTYHGDPRGQYHEKEGVTIVQMTKRVLPSLNRFPKNWQHYRCDCVYRKIEPQWFIVMCSSRG